jgi:nucleotide-binding universal stress UspA family protein
MRILLAVDGSPCSDTAVEEVGRRPWPEGSSIKVLSVFELPTPVAPLTPEAWSLPINYEEMDVSLRTQAKIVVEQTLKKLKSTVNKTIAIDGQCVPGSPRAVILDVAETWGADLIVVGSHGYRAWERFLLGSVSQSVVSHARCSVEVVRCPENVRLSKDQARRKEKER